MTNLSQLTDLAREFESRLLLFQQTLLHRFYEKSNSSPRPNSPPKRDDSPAPPPLAPENCTPKCHSPGGSSPRFAGLQDIPSCRSLLNCVSNLQCELSTLRESIASFLTDGHDLDGVIEGDVHLPMDRLERSSSPTATTRATVYSSGEVCGCLDPTEPPLTEDNDPLVAFITSIETSLRSCDVDTPGTKTAPPPNPSQSGIRQSRETRISVWSAFYRAKDKPLPRELQLQLREPTFNNWSFSDAELLCFVRFFFTGGPCGSGDADGAADSLTLSVDERLQLTRLCGIKEATLDTWLCAIYANYNSVHFHNFKHAFMVTQMMYASICCADLASLFCHLDLFTLIFSAICHDLDHPGLTNVYQNNSQSRLSICYNTLSPLENHHCSVAFELVRTPSTNIFAAFSDREFDIIRQNTARCILGTDMAKHTDILDTFTAKLLEHSISTDAVVDGGGGGTPDFSQLSTIFDNDDEFHTLTMVILLKMCDISTEIRPDFVARPWLDALIDELSNQHDLERQSGLPLSPVMDKANLVDCQVKFLSFAMLPLARAVSSIIPALNSCFLTPTQQQLVHYTQLAALQQQQQASTELSPVAAVDEFDSRTDDGKKKKKATTTRNPKTGVSADNRGDDVAAVPTHSVTPTALETSSVSAFSEVPVRASHNEHGVRFASEAGSAEVISIPRDSRPSPDIPRLHQRCISSSDPDQEFLGYHHTYYARIHHHHKRTSIVSSAGLIAAELTPPHRPLRRSVGELPWSAHALILTQFEEGYCLLPQQAHSRMSLHVPASDALTISPCSGHSVGPMEDLVESVRETENTAGGDATPRVEKPNTSP